MTGKPWMKFYPADWRSDPRLRMVSLEARGLWMEMLCIMHEADTYGELTVSGRPLASANLAAFVGCEKRVASRLLHELEKAAVFSRTSENVIFSRRMKADFQKAKEAAENGKKGGNPNLTDNQGVNPPLKAQKPEARSQSLEEGTNVPSRSSDSDFEVWWSKYPHKVGKGQAKAAFPKALKLSGLDQLLAGVDAYIQAKPPDRSWCNPATWLNGQRWLDEPGIEPTPSNLRTVSSNDKPSLASAKLAASFAGSQLAIDARRRRKLDF